MKDLSNWVSEILNAMYPNLVRYAYSYFHTHTHTLTDPAVQQSNGLFTNYADNNATFADAASTALIASATYRHALLNNVHTNLPHAEQSRLALVSPAMTPSNSSLAHFDSNMWLTPVVNPHSFGQEGSKSPEAQAFVVEMQAAWKDWVAAGSPGANDAARSSGSIGWTFWLPVFGAIFYTLF